MTFKEQSIGFKTIVSDEIWRFLRIWPQTLLSSAITTTIYFVIFSNFTNTKIEKLYGISYMEYIAPGLIMMAIIINAYGNVSFSLWNHRFQHCIEEMIVAPLPNYLILTGYVLGGVLRGIIVGAIVTVIALFFTKISLSHFFITAGIVFFTAILFSLAGFTNAILADKFDDIMYVPTFILTPLIYLGGVFYSITQLPVFWQGVSKANPLLYIINTFRYGILGISDIDIHLSMLIVISTVILLFIFNLHLLNKGLGIHT